MAPKTSPNHGRTRAFEARGEVFSQDLAAGVFGAGGWSEQKATLAMSGAVVGQKERLRGCFWSLVLRDKWC